MTKNKVKPPTKVVIRKLPPTMTEEVFLKQIDPLPENDLFYFVPADWSLGHDSTSRAYINFVNQEDIFLFKDRFDGYVFVDNKGAEYPAIVEFAPFQGLSKIKIKKKDPKCNTIETDPQYINFIEKRNNELNEAANKSDFKLEYSFQLKSDKKITSTPLLQYLANRRQERKDERKKKMEQKRKQRDEERLRRKMHVMKSIPSQIKEEEVTLDKKDKLENKDKSEDLKKTSRSKRRLEREQKRKEERERRDRDQNSKSLNSKEQRESSTDKKKLEKEKKIEENSGQNKFYKEEENVETVVKVTDKSDEKNLKKEEEKPDNPSEVTESVRAFFMTVAEISQKTKSSNKNQEENSAAMEEFLDLERSKQSETSEKSDSVKNILEDKRKEERGSQRIRNKDRPSIEIYQPGKMRLKRGESNASNNNGNNRVNSEAKDYRSDSRSNPTSDCDIPRPKEEKSNVRKKVSRYSERRSIQNRDKKLDETIKLDLNVAVEIVDSDPLKEGDVTVTVEETISPTEENN